MSATLTTHDREGLITWIGKLVVDASVAVGELTLFFLDMLVWLLTHLPRRPVLFMCMYQIGVQSLSVVMVTGGFIGMVMAVQSYDQFRFMHLETNLGAVINISLVKELGPVLAATMLAGRVGSSMAAELGTMKITEQIDALRVLGANPMHYLVVPRFLACVLLIPMLTVMADAAGVFGGWLISTQVCGIDSLHYWNHTEAYIGSFELFSGIVKSVFFGAAIAVVSCQRGFHCRAGAEGVGRAATEAFVYSFVAILTVDFFLGIVANGLYPWLVK
ncbi:MAG: ABC transporter permease [Planctomycetia bacterium]|nr:ABC transporter permease [Planctomycetia bacterium]